MADRQADAYVEVRARVPRQSAETAEWLLLEAGALGTASVGLDDEPGATILVTGYFLPDRVPSLEALAADLEAHGLTRARDRLELRTQRWRDWAAESRRHFQPVRLTPAVVLAPPWDIPAQPDRALLVIEPGAAFGIGTHGTTRGCVELVEAWAGERADTHGREARPWTMLDVGTGTGILAMRACQLGASRAVAFDIEPDAIATAVRNLAHNRLRAIACFAGTLAALRDGRRFDLVAANILRDPLLEIAVPLAAHTAEGGALILSGFHAEDVPAVIERYAALGLAPGPERAIDGWASVRFDRAMPGRRETPAAGSGPIGQSA